MTRYSQFRGPWAPLAIPGYACILGSRLQNATVTPGIIGRGESKPERRSGKIIIAGTAFRLEFLVGWYYDVDATMAVPELY